MAGKISQRSIVAMTRVFNVFTNRNLNYAEILYEHDFPDWFIGQATQRYDWTWPPLIIDLRSGNFFFVRDRFGGPVSILPEKRYQPQEGAAAWVVSLIQRLASFAATLPGSEELV